MFTQIKSWRQRHWLSLALYGAAVLPLDVLTLWWWHFSVWWLLLLCLPLAWLSEVVAGAIQRARHRSGK